MILKIFQISDLKITVLTLLAVLSLNIPIDTKAGTSAYDFHLRPGSIAIDHGVCLEEVPNDFDGNSRPSGKGCDIGAYEYQQSTGLTITDFSANVIMKIGIIIVLIIMLGIEIWRWARMPRPAQVSTRKIINMVRVFIRRNGYPPTRKELCKMLNMKEGSLRDRIRHIDELQTAKSSRGCVVYIGEE